MAAEIDKELQTTLKQARAGRPMQFAFLGKGAGGKLLAAKKLAPKLIADAKKAEGGTLFKGRLLGEGDRLVFEVAKEPPAALAAQLKRCIKEHAGLTGEIVVRVNADAEADLEPAAEPGREQVPPSPPPPTPAGDPQKAAVLKRINGLGGAIKAALAGPNKSRVQALFVGANGLIKTGDFAQAAKVLDELEPLVSTPAPAVPPPPSPTADLLKAAVMRRLNALGGPLKVALAGPDGARVKALFVSINGLIKNADFAQAGKVLDELEPLLAAPPPPPPESPATTLSLWQQAKDLIDGQIGTLQAAFREANDPLSLQIADQGLTGLTRNLQVGLHVALVEYDRSAGEARAGASAKVQARVGELRKFLQANPALPLLEKNPFGVPVTIRASLGAALDAIEKAAAQ